MKLRPIHCLLIATLAPAGAARGAEDEGLALWRDPRFQREFLGTYGVRAEIEPRVTSVEQQAMESVLAMMEAEDGMDRARLFLEKAAKPASSAIFDFTLANIYFQQGDLERAAQWYAKAVEKLPSFQRAHKNLGLVRVRSGAYEEAVGPLTRAIGLGATDGLTFGLLGYAYLMTEQHTPAEGAYRQAMMLQPEAIDWKLGLARTLFKQRRYAEAASLCGELIEREPGRADYWLLQANAYLGLKLPLKAAENYEYLDASGASTVQSLNTLGDVYVNEGLMDLAADAYTRAMEKEERGDPAPFVRNAEVLGARGAHSEAERFVARLQELFGDRLDAEQRKRLLKLEARLAAARGIAAAEQAALLEQIVALDPLDGEALILLGQHESASGNLEKAAFLFERAAGMERHEAEARLRYAQCLVRNGRYQEALPLLRRVQELRPREEVARYLEQVERVARARS